MPVATRSAAPGTATMASLVLSGRAMATTRLSARTAIATVSASAPCTITDATDRPSSASIRITADEPAGRPRQDPTDPAEESPGSTGQGGCQQQPGVTRGTVPQKTDRRRASVGKGE